MDLFNPAYPDIQYYVHRKCREDWGIVSDVNDFHDLTYVVSGEGVYKIDGADYPVKAGDVLYITPGRRRQAWTSQKALMEVYAINFFLDARLPFELKNYAGYDSKLILLFTQLTRVWMEKEDMYALEAGALTTQIICELYRRLYRDKPANRLDERIERVKNYINENYQTPLTLPKLAQLAGLNPVYFGAMFSHSEHYTVKEYINKVRVQHAYEILRAEKLSVSDVALSCGFNDQFYFSRVFKRYIGVSPTKI